MTRAGRARAATLALFCALIAELVAWHSSHLRGHGLAIALLFTALPPVLPLPGLWRSRRYTYRWAPLTLAPAMGWSLTELVASPGARVAAAASAFTGFLALAAIVATLRTMPPRD